jgi:MerR family transcriptional regulator/heat shock protein HspR
MQPERSEESQRHRHGQLRAVYVISVAAELSGMHPQTLRIYERKGLVDPARTGGGSRRYSDQDIARLRRIQDLTNAGVNLEGVRRIIELEEEIKSLRSELRASGRDVDDRSQKGSSSFRPEPMAVSTALVLYRQHGSFLRDERR